MHHSSVTFHINQDLVDLFHQSTGSSCRKPICDGGRTWSRRQEALQLGYRARPVRRRSIPAHGIKSYPSPLLSTTDAEASAKSIAEVAERHGEYLTTFTSLGYDIPGYGYGDRSVDGAPLFQVRMGELTAKYNVPYIVDDAWGAPIIGTDFRKTGASVVLYSCDKGLRGPLSGLMIGKDEAMVPIRRALGIHSHRFGNPSAYAKAMYSAFDSAGKLSSPRM